MSLKGENGVYLPKELADDLTKLTKSYLDPSGKEVLNPMPMVIHSDLSRPLTLQEQIARILRTREFTQAMNAQDRETWEEANDFDIGDPLLDGNDDTKYTVMTDEFPAQEIQKKETTTSPPSDGMTEESPGDNPQSPEISDSVPPTE